MSARRTHARATLVAYAAVALSATLPAAGCAARQGSAFDGARRDAPVEVEVRNDNYLDVTVHVLPDGVSHRLGDVTGAGSATFEIPPRLIFGTRSLRILVNPIGSPAAYLSEEILVSPGDRIVLRVASQLHMSTWSVR